MNILVIEITNTTTLFITLWLHLQPIVYLFYYGYIINSNHNNNKLILYDYNSSDYSFTSLQTYIGILTITNIIVTYFMTILTKLVYGFAFTVANIVLLLWF